VVDVHIDELDDILVVDFAQELASNQVIRLGFGAPAAAKAEVR
jgi:hypothetical protein